MKMTFYTANCRGNAKNSLYPNVVRQIICIYFLHIKCTRFWCSLEERSKLLHLFAQFIWDCFGAVLYKQFLPFFFFQRLEP